MQADLRLARPAETWNALLRALAHVDLPDRVRRSLTAETNPEDESAFVAALDQVIAAIDAVVGDVLDVVVHHPDFQRLEAAWRGLKYVADHVPFHENTQLAVWNVSKDELAEDFGRAADRTRSAFFSVVHTAEFGQFGGTPYAVVLADFTFDATPADVTLLRNVASVAAMAHAPFFASASARLFRLRAWMELPLLRDPAAFFEESRYREWNALREEEDSRYLGLLVGRVLLRAPYRESVESLTYAETVGADGDELLWGSPTFPLALVFARSFAAYRTLGGIVGEEAGVPPPLRTHSGVLGRRYTKPPLEVTVTPRLEGELSALGLIALQHDVETPRIHLASARSMQRGKRFGQSSEGREATLNYELGTQFAYLFLACRIAHYLKLLEIERIGADHTREEIEKELNDWLSRYVVDMDSVEPAIRASRPLRQAQVAVVADSGSPSWYRAQIRLRPHLKYLGSSVTLEVSSWMEHHHK